MFSKNNLKYILILALGFFTCSSIYLTEGIILKNSSSTELSNIVSVLFGSFAMAIGVLIFSILYKKVKNIKKYYFVSVLITLISLIVFFITKNVLVSSSCLILSCMLSVSGLGGAYNFSLIASNVEETYQGRVFAIGYALGSILSYLLSLFNNYNITLYINIAVIIINLFLVYHTKSIVKEDKENITPSFKKYFLSLSIIIISMASLLSISQEIMSYHTLNSSEHMWFANTRIYYSLGLIISGIVYDKRNDIFDICLPISFIYPLISLVLFNQNVSLILVSGLSYFFLGFFSIFRALVFIKLSSKYKGFIYIAAYGLMYERIVEGLFMLLQLKLLKNYMVLLVLEAILLGIVLAVYLFFYLNNKNKEDTDIIKNLAIKNGLSIQEEKVLNLLMKDLTNQEIADELYLSINTIRNHVANIYRKTGMNKKELREKCYYGT